MPPRLRSANQWPRRWHKNACSFSGASLTSTTSVSCSALSRRTSCVASASHSTSIENSPEISSTCRSAHDCAGAAGVGATAAAALDWSDARPCFIEA